MCLCTHSLHEKIETIVSWKIKSPGRHWCDISAYCTFSLLPNLIELDVFKNLLVRYISMMSINEKIVLQIEAEELMMKRMRNKKESRVWKRLRLERVCLSESTIIIVTLSSSHLFLLTPSHNFLTLFYKNKAGTTLCLSEYLSPTSKISLSGYWNSILGIQRRFFEFHKFFVFSTLPQEYQLPESFKKTSNFFRRM